MSDEDICGSTNTTSGEPCQFSPGESCPWHDVDEPPRTRITLLEEEPHITELVAGELQNESTVPEACAEAGISVSQYEKWYARGRDEDADDIFRDFRRECRRARMIAAGSDRETVKRHARENGDTRTLWKAHMQQYGDIYAEEGAEPAAETVPFGVPDDLIEKWRHEA